MPATTLPLRSTPVCRGGGGRRCRHLVTLTELRTRLRSSATGLLADGSVTTRQRGRLGHVAGGRRHVDDPVGQVGPVRGRRIHHLAGGRSPVELGEMTVSVGQAVDAAVVTLTSLDSTGWRRPPAGGGGDGVGVVTGVRPPPRVGAEHRSPTSATLPVVATSTGVAGVAAPPPPRRPGSAPPSSPTILPRLMSRIPIVLTGPKPGWFVPADRRPVGHDLGRDEHQRFGAPRHPQRFWNRIAEQRDVNSGTLC